MICQPGSEVQPMFHYFYFFFFQAEDGIRDKLVTGVQTCALPICTTYIWVDYLSKVSKEWDQKVGRGTSVNWPVGLGGKGNEGVAGQIKNTPGALGYVELAYAIKNKLPAASVRNAAGTFVEPSIETTTAAAAGSAMSMPADFRVSLTNPPGDHAYPIASFTWLLVYKDQPDETKGKPLVKFLRWMIHDGQKYTADLLHAPPPPQVVN